MLSIIYTIMVACSLLGGLLFGSVHEVSTAAMEGAKSAVTVLFSLAGPMCLWCGVGELMRRTGLREILSRMLSPLLGRLFPRLKNNRDGFSALSANVSANLLGLGNAATPMGIAACKAMGDGTGTATDEQCRLVVMNTASIQLLPTTIAALRASLGCTTPLDILPAVLLTSLFSVSAGLMMAAVLGHRCKHGL